MKPSFAQLSDDDKQATYAEVAKRTNVLPVIVEKDFWVCWMLGHIFATPSLGDH